MTKEGLFSQFVEPGRFSLIRYGPLAGKTCTIVDMIDIKRVVVEGAEVPRQQIPIKWISLTELKCRLQRGAASKYLKKSLAAAGIEGKWAASTWAKKIAAKSARSNLTDFERFKLSQAKKKVGQAVRKSLKK